MKTGILRKFDWILFADVLAITFIGLLFIFSAQMRNGNPMFYVVKQSTALAIGVAAMLLVISVRYELYSEYTKYFYFFALVLLIAVLIAGSRIRGIKSWFNFGKFAFQPIELAKITMILFLAKFIHVNHHQMKKISRLLVPFAALSAYVIFIMMEPDFSGASVFIAIFFCMMYVGGASGRVINLVILFFIVAGCLPFVETYLLINYADTAILKHFRIIYCGVVILFVFLYWFFMRAMKFRMTFKQYRAVILVVLLGLISAVAISGHLKNYQRMRIVVFLDPSLDPLGSGYNILQSRIAIGSGQVTGRGIFQGTQTQLGFIPDQHTDYIFAVLSEEGGFVFSFLIIFLYAVLIARGISIAKNAADRFGSLTAVGIVVMFSYNIILNLGMLTGIMPVAGVPLPFLSFGGSYLIVNMIAVGLLINIHIRRYAY